MAKQYRMVRQGLEAARSWLPSESATDSSTDQNLCAIIDQLIEVITEIEYRKGGTTSNVVPFPMRPAARG
jgi:hypothetical protein